MPTYSTFISPLAVIGVGPIIKYGTPTGLTLGVLSVDAGLRDFTSGVLGKGIGRVRGTVKLAGTPSLPVSRRVRLVREKDGLVVREQWSIPATGGYDFKYVDEMQSWTVISYDHTLDKRAVIADNLTLANLGVELIA